MKTAKNNSQKMVDDYNEKWRDAEGALLRQLNRCSISGDGVRLAAVGLDDPGRQKQEIDRLRAVQAQQENAGTAAEFRRARENFHEVAPRVEIETKEIEARVASLREQLASELSRKQSLSEELAQADADLKERTRARDRLRGAELLPRHITVELNARRTAINSNSADRQQELSGLIRHLRADAGRLESQRNSEGRIENQKMLEEYAERSAVDPRHRAHSFWRDRVWSLSEWENFEEWCTARADEYQQELDQIREDAERELDEEAEKLLGFYTDAIE